MFTSKSTRSYKVNIVNPVYALMTADTAEGATYGEVKSFGEAMTIQITPQVATGSLYGNGAVVDTSVKTTALAVQFESTKVDIEAKAEIYNLDVQDGVVLEKAGVSPNYIAFGYAVEHSDNTKEYVWLTKGRPQPATENNSQSQDNVTYSTDSMSMNFVARNFDKVLRYFADESNPDFTAEQAEKWFDEGPSAVVTKS